MVVLGAAPSIANGLLHSFDQVPPLLVRVGAIARLVPTPSSDAPRTAGVATSHKILGSAGLVMSSAYTAGVKPVMPGWPLPTWNVSTVFHSRRPSAS